MPHQHPHVMPHQHSFHINEGMVDHRWLGSDKICEQYWFVDEDFRWLMADVQVSTRFMGDFWFTEKND
jgi:hypothetical protein